MPKHFSFNLVHLLIAFGLATFCVVTALPVEDQTSEFSLRKETRELSEEELDAQYAAKNKFQENFDPAKADPSGNITCFGDRFDLEFPTQDGWNPNERNYQQICAKPQYGGGGEYQHVGGWCSPLDDGRVAFDSSDDAKINAQLFKPRLLLSCRDRCSCNKAMQNPGIQPKPTEPPPALLGVYQMDSHLTYQLSLDVQNDFTTPWDQQRGVLDVDVNSVRVPYIGPSTPLGGVHVADISEDQGNRITCAGPLPSFRLPSPYNNSDFPTVQHLCAIQLDGGLRGANAGAYCHRNDDGTRTPWFADDLTPRPEWTWRGGLFAAAASIRFHCLQHCTCGGTTDKNTTEPFWQFVDGHIQSLRNKDGSFSLQATSSSDSSSNSLAQGTTFIGNGAASSPNKKQKTNSVSVLPPQNPNSNNNPSGTCGPANNTFCPSPWPTDILGPIPRAPPNASEVVTPYVAKGSKADLTVCGNKCAGPQDCSSPRLNNTETDHGCTCAFPSEHDVRILGLDPVAPVAVCLVLMRAVFAAGVGQGKGGLIGRAEGGYDGQGRMWAPNGDAAGEVAQEGWEDEAAMVSRRAGEGELVSRFVDSRGELALCRCNATFAHNECCGVESGMVWLDDL